MHKLSATDSDGVIARLTPFRSEQPVTFEFLAISDGTNEPVEFYYGTDTELEATLVRKNERIDALEAEIERLEEALAAGGREPGQSNDARPVDAAEDDDEPVEASVWIRTKRWLGSDAT